MKKLKDISEEWNKLYNLIEFRKRHPRLTFIIKPYEARQWRKIDKRLDEAMYDFLLAD